MDSGTPGPGRDPNRRLAELEAEARYARERHRLYRAKAYGPRLTSAGRLRDLERRSQFAQTRLDRARAAEGRRDSLVKAR
jgi:hypothetical protein